MNKFLFAAAVGAAAVAAGAPAASAQIYGGVGYTAFKTTVEPTPGTSEDVLLGGAFGRLGYKFNPIFGIEGEYAFGIGEDNYQVGATEFDFGLDKGYGAYAVGWLPIPLVADLFARVGYADLSFDDDNPVAPSNDGGGLAYGGGIQFAFLVARIRAEYTRYEAGGEPLDSLGASVLLQF